MRGDFHARKIATPVTEEAARVQPRSRQEAARTSRVELPRQLATPGSEDVDCDR